MFFVVVVVIPILFLPLPVAFNFFVVVVIVVIVFVTWCFKIIYLFDSCFFELLSFLSSIANKTSKLK
jgi:hypothetical protein